VPAHAQALLHQRPGSSRVAVGLKLPGRCIHPQARLCGREAAKRARQESRQRVCFRGLWHFVNEQSVTRNQGEGWCSHTILCFTLPTGTSQGWTTEVTNEG
jgi:hypothetical protein